ncbi:helix-turn-helix domain-containing protein [Halobacillus sp. Cin3]|uniref:TrmB family transcriptional regulator n=1 Tax=Halobacillus sp. Cin3 TaxID=2928441 RepID=UPI00248EE9A3|nr:helix-turn-helix domain-containing protein [Halobacillus sp. Cin3]
MLQNFGFTQYESQVYEVLSSSDQALDAATVVKYSHVPKSKVYEVLQRLEEKGLILTSFHEKKKLYTALPIEMTIKKLTAEFEDHIEQLRNHKSEIPDADERVWTLKNNHSIHVLMENLIEKAANEILLTGWNDELTPFVDLLERKQAEGIHVELLSVGEIPVGELDPHTLVPDERHQGLERHKLLIIDGREVLFAGMERDQFQGVHTLSKPLVKFFTEFFYHDVALLEITKKHHETLKKDDDITSILMKLRY